jgi:mRNA-degrading endonuclease RelE of RelBE toxin-antitoxin system
MNTIEWSKKASKQLRDIPKTDGKRIVKKVEELENFPNTMRLDITALESHDHSYRLRVGRYRVLFDFDDEIKIISVEEVKKRDERTY